ncbi:transcriptional regulator [Helicobacter sp. MIT 14-3879]|uniref:transcriptional regulator n=1 Tax=Helicobacter sp. MIT 14-3879 TaxID=2040649 RepID=UPI0015F13950|nr:transcriptional regulator [Helicobacter sp. MIT 14-3879]
MQYILKNKDKEVLRFETSTIEEYSELVGKFFTTSISRIEIIDEKLLPSSIKTINTKEDLNSWILNRKVPKNRRYFDEIVLSYKPKNNKEGLMDYIDISLGLSLNDSYWIIPATKDYQWRDFNLYDNEFSEALALTAFGLHLTKVQGFTSSPEYTTNGMLKKCWHRDNGQIYLYKGSSEMYNGFGEVYSEYYMAQIAEVMEFDYVPYDIKEFHNQIVSSCPLFTNENEGYAPIYYCVDKKILEKKDLRSIVAIANVYGNENFQDLMLFDALICNIDRHLGNFGMIIDNNTNEILRPAPIFDNGFSMINYLTQDELVNINKALGLKESYFGYSFDEQMKIFVANRHIPNLQKLSNFTFKRHKEFNLSDEWLEPINYYINQRAKLALKFIEEKMNSTLNKDVLIHKVSKEIRTNSQDSTQALLNTKNSKLRKRH